MTSAFHRRSAAALCAVTGICLAPAAQARTAAAQSDVEETSEEAAQPAAGWQIEPELRLTARLIASEARVGAEDDTIDGDAIALVAIPTLSLGKGSTAITLRNALTRVEYLDEARSDRWQNVARLSGRFGIGVQTSVTLFGERGDNLFAAEFTSADEWEGGGEIEHRIDRANRIQLGVSWRERRYDDAARSRGNGIRIDGEYRHRIAANHFAYLRARHERIGSAEARRQLSRWLAEASYLRPIARDLRAGAELSYQRLEFSGRTLATGGVRKDDIVTPQVSLTYSPGAWRFAARARYALRDSTDPAFDRSGYRLELEVSHAF